MERIYIFISPDEALTQEELNLILEFFPDDDGHAEETSEDRGDYWRYTFIADFYCDDESDPEYNHEFDSWDDACERAKELCGRLNFIFPYTFKVNDGSCYGHYEESR